MECPLCRKALPTRNAGKKHMQRHLAEVGWEAYPNAKFFVRRLWPCCRKEELPPLPPKYVKRARKGDKWNETVLYAGRQHHLHRPDPAFVARIGGIDTVTVEASEKDDDNA